MQAYGWYPQEAALFLKKEMGPEYVRCLNCLADFVNRSEGCPRKGHVMKHSATDTNLLAVSISVDVIIKINCIHFIEKKNLLNKNKAFGTLETGNPFSSAVEKFR